MGSPKGECGGLGVRKVAAILDEDHSTVFRALVAFREANKIEGEMSEAQLGQFIFHFLSQREEQEKEVVMTAVRQLTEKQRREKNLLALPLGRSQKRNR